MVKDKRIFDETMENLDGMFRYCFLMVGLRPKNFPNELETLFLHEFIKENYGGHSIEEVKMAFRMAVKSELDLQEDEVTCYENFSVRYISNILNSYRRWAAQEFRRLEKHIQPTEAEMKLLEGPVQDIHWGSIIEKEYQHFLSFGDEHWKIFPVGFYDQLVTDGIFDSDFYRKAMTLARKKLIGELQRELTSLQIIPFNNEVEENSREELAQSIRQANINAVKEKIDGYKSGESDSVIEIAAKQYCVLQFFKNSKESMKQHVYVTAE